MNSYFVSGIGPFRYRSLTVATPPAIYPVSLAEAKSHLRVDEDFLDDDSYIQSLVAAATDHVEGVSDRSLIRRQYRMRFDLFPAWDIPLPRPPIAYGPIEVTYVPSDGVYSPVSYTNFREDRDATPAVIRPQWNGTWPTTRGAENDVTVTYWAGYGEDSISCPAPARHCILMIASHWYSTRESVIQGGMNPVPMAVEILLGAINWGQYR
jgi:uncharacterized phiE125 gp8 family phage protein